MAAPIVTEIEVRTKAAEQSLQAFRDAMAKAGGASDQVTKTLDEQNQTFLKLTASTDSLAKARLQYEANERRAMAALTAGKIGVEQYTQALQGQIDKLSALIAKQNQVSKSGASASAPLAEMGAQTERLRRMAEAQSQLASGAKNATESSLGFIATAGKYGLVITAIKEVIQTFTAVQRAIAGAGDAVAMQTAKVRLATETLMGGGQAFGEVTRIANAVGAPLEATAALFARIGRSAADAGVTATAEVSRAVETFQKLAIVSGASTTEAAAGAMQLGQGLAAGRLNGDELRSVLENMPPIARAIAKEFGVTVGQLRDLGAAGELVSDRVLKAILTVSQDADRQFAAMPKTVERASQSMANSWTLFLAQLNESLGVSRSLVASFEKMQGLIGRAGKLIAPLSPDEQLANARAGLAQLDLTGATGMAAEGFGRKRQRAAQDQQRREILKQIAILEAESLERAAVAGADETARAQAQKQALQERLDGLNKERAAELARAEYSSKLSKDAQEELKAYDKAFTESRAKTSGMDKAIQEEQAKRAGEQAVALLRLTRASEDRWKAEAEGARAAEKAATDAARQAERNAKESEKAALDEQKARDDALESVDQQIEKIEEESRALGLTARQRAVTNEVLRAEATLKKGLVNLNQELYDAEIARVELAAGQKFDAEEAVRLQQRAADEASRNAERMAEEAERPMRNLFDNLQRGTAQVFQELLSGTLNTGQALKKVLLNAAAEYLSAIAIKPAFEAVGGALGIGDRRGGTSVGSFNIPGVGGGGGFGGITSAIDSFGYNTFGIGTTGLSNSTAATFGAAPGEVVNAIGGATGSTGLAGGAVTGGLSSYLPFAGAGIGAITQFASGNVGGGAGTLVGAGIGSMFGPVGIGVGSALGGLVGGLFGGKKPSVGPGGGVGFGVNADGTANIGFTAGDNGYDATSANLGNANLVGAGALNFFNRVGGTFQGTAVSTRGAELGYDAGLKKFTGGDNTSNGAGRFDTLEQAMTASLITTIKNSVVTGVSKEIQDRIAAISTSQDMENLLQYIDGLKKITEAFAGWKEPLSQVETAMNGLQAAFDQAKAAAETLSQPVDDLTASYTRQMDYLKKGFVNPLVERELVAVGRGDEAAQRRRDAEAEQLRKDAALLGADAMAQVERTLAAERVQIAEAAAKAQQDAAEATAKAQQDAAEATAKAQQQAADAAEAAAKAVQAAAEAFSQARQNLVDSLIQRELRAVGRGGEADQILRDREAAQLRANAAQYGADVLSQVERTLAAERTQIAEAAAKAQIEAAQAAAEAVAAAAKTQRDAATSLAEGAASALQSTYDGLVNELRAAKQAEAASLASQRDLWKSIAENMRQFRDSLLVGALSPMSPEAQMREAQRQFSETLAKAKGGDAQAAGQVQGLAQTALQQTQSFYASSQPYADYFQSVQDQLNGLAGYADTQSLTADRQLAAMNATATNTRDTATILKDLANIIPQLAGAQVNVVSQRAGNNGAAGASITQAYNQYLGRSPDDSGAAFWGNQIATGIASAADVTKAIANSPEGQVYKAYQDILGRAPDAGGSQFWQSLITGGSSIEQVRAAIASSAEAQGRTFADGGMHTGGWRIVGERGPELEMTGPSRIWNADQIRNVFSGNDNSAAAEIRALRAEVSQLRTALVGATMAGAGGVIQAVQTGSDNEARMASAQARMASAPSANAA